MENPENPIIENCERYGYPDGPPKWPHCPICGEECDTLFRNNHSKKILGCDNCVDEYDAWECEEEML